MKEYIFFLIVTFPFPLLQSDVRSFADLQSVAIEQQRKDLIENRENYYEEAVDVRTIEQVLF